MAALIYSLCAVTAALCAWRLLTAHTRTRLQLLLWGGICFALFALNNALVVVDRVLLPEVNLFSLRLITALLGMAALLYGLIWDAK